MDAMSILGSRLGEREVEETFPFGPDTLVFKTSKKIFLLVSLDTMPVRFNAKCAPEKALELREQYAGIVPGYHMNKKHWNTVQLDGSIPDTLVKELIEDSYQLVQKRRSLKPKE